MNWKKIDDSTYLAHAPRSVGGRYELRHYAPAMTRDEWVARGQPLLHGIYTGPPHWEVNHLTSMRGGGWRKRRVGLAKNATLGEAIALAKADLSRQLNLRAEVTTKAT